MIKFSRIKVIFYSVQPKNNLIFRFSRDIGKKKLEILQKLNLNVAEKPDSQDICLYLMRFSSVIKKFRPESFKPGNILDIKEN